MSYYDGDLVLYTDHLSLYFKSIDMEYEYVIDTEGYCGGLGVFKEIWKPTYL